MGTQITGHHLVNVPICDTCARDDIDYPEKIGACLGVAEVSLAIMGDSTQLDRE